MRLVHVLVRATFRASLSSPIRRDTPSPCLVGFRSVRTCALVALASSALACNAIVGVEEVELNCHVAAETAVPPAAVWQLDNSDDAGDPVSQLSVQPVAMTTLYIWLWDGGEHGAFTAGTYPLTPDDGSRVDCSLCVELDVGFGTPTGAERWVYAARPQGNLTLTTRSVTEVTGSMQNLRFRHVTDEGVEVNDGCSTIIRQLAFDAR